MVEVAEKRFAPSAYHDFIGFEVDRPLLNKAFHETYGIEVESVLKNETLAINTYRHAISSSIPKAVKIAWHIKRKEIKKDLPGITRRKFLYHMSEASYQKNWGSDYRKPTCKEKFYAFLLKLVPKIGRFKALKFRIPTPQAEKLFEESFNAALSVYSRELTQLKAGHIKLSNDNFDVGTVSKPGQYFLSDNTYAELLDRLTKQDFCGLTPSLRSDILRFYADPNAPYATKNNPTQWDTVQSELEQLRNLKSIKMLIQEKCTTQYKSNAADYTNKKTRRKSSSL